MPSTNNHAYCHLWSLVTVVLFPLVVPKIVQRQHPVMLTSLHMTKTMGFLLSILVATTQVVLSDSAEPGEGGHKMMRFMRHVRSLPKFNPNFRHMIYGQVGPGPHCAHLTPCA